VIHPCVARRAIRGVVALSIICACAGARAQPAAVVAPAAQDGARTSDTTFEERIDPWSRWTLRIYKEPVPGRDEYAQGVVEARLLTRRLDSHQIEAGAAMVASPVEPDPIDARQEIDERRSSLFVEDRWHWSGALTMTAGARLIDASGGAAIHRRVSLGWQPAAAWTLKLTQGDVQSRSSAATLPLHQFRGIEVQTEHSAGSLRLRARAASQRVSDPSQSQVLNVAAVTLAMPLDARWAVASETLVARERNLTRLKLAGSMAQKRATLSLLLPRRFGGRPTDAEMNAGLMALQPDDTCSWRAQLELRL
jgi:hypothetical protein